MPEGSVEPLINSRLAPERIAGVVQPIGVWPAQIDEITASPREPGQLAILISDVSRAGLLAATEDDAVVNLVVTSMLDPLAVIHRPHATDRGTSVVAHEHELTHA
jgi:hypothetical protein